MKHHKYLGTKELLVFDDGSYEHDKLVRLPANTEYFKSKCQYYLKLLKHPFIYIEPDPNKPFNPFKNTIHNLDINVMIKSKELVRFYFYEENTIKVIVDDIEFKPYISI